MQTQDQVATGAPPTQGDPTLSPMERLIRRAALGFSRRSLLKRAAALGAVTLGIQLFNALPVVAASCNECGGFCSPCGGGSPVCCSPNGQYCWQSSCSCPSCTCHVHAPYIKVCDDGAYTYSCPWCA